MSKSKWIEVMEWCVLAAIVLVALGVFLTGTDYDPAIAGTPLSYFEE